jgi:hypothetical protein
MQAFHQVIGAKRMHELGFGTRNQFAEVQAELIYGKVPMTAPDSEENVVC